MKQQLSWQFLFCTGLVIYGIGYGLQHTIITEAVIIGDFIVVLGGFLVIGSIIQGIIQYLRRH